MSTTSFWQSFPVDPRRPENARMRASDADRAVVADLLTEAYADGRLTREELDERNEGLQQAKVLADVRPLVEDLIAVEPSVPALPTGAGLATDEQIRTEAEAYWRSRRRESLLGFLGPSTICVVIWAALMLGTFFWPAFVILGTGMNVMRVHVNREDIVAERVRTLQKRRSKEIKRLSPKDDDAAG